MAEPTKLRMGDNMNEVETIMLMQNPENGTDAVNHPEHYTQGGIECIDALEAATEGMAGIEAVCTANAIKYLWRWKRKNGVEDLKKARWYIDHLIDHEQRR